MSDSHLHLRTITAVITSRGMASRRLPTADRSPQNLRTPPQACSDVEIRSRLHSVSASVIGSSRRCLDWISKTAPPDLFGEAVVVLVRYLAQQELAITFQEVGAYSM